MRDVVRRDLCSPVRHPYFGGDAVFDVCDPLILGERGEVEYIGEGFFRTDVQVPARQVVRVALESQDTAPVVICGGLPGDVANLHQRRAIPFQYVDDDVKRAESGWRGHLHDGMASVVEVLAEAEQRAVAEIGLGGRQGKDVGGVDREVDRTGGVQGIRGAIVETGAGGDRRGG